jgi:hypothetical protein
VGALIDESPWPFHRPHPKIYRDLTHVLYGRAFSLRIREHNAKAKNGRFLPFLKGL